MSESTPTVIIPAAAVDVGFHQTKYAYNRDKSGAISVGSFASVAANPDHVRDDAARQSGFVAHSKAGDFFVGESAVHYLPTTAARGYRSGYALEPRYMAYYDGALGSIVQSRCVDATFVKVQQMVVGLPYADYFDYRDKLQAACGGLHKIEGARGEITIDVQHVRVVPQPMGALFSAVAGPFPRAGESIVLTSDMGGGTHDVYLTNALNPERVRCGSSPVGTLSIAKMICELCKTDAGEQPQTLAKVDAALRAWRANPREHDGKVIVGGKPRNLADYTEQINREVDVAVAEMAKRVGKPTDVDLIIFTGGGAELMREGVSRHENFKGYEALMHVDRDPVYSNVRGFYIRAEQLQRASADAKRPAREAAQ